ncbi:hypothetical protein [Streptomyces sp. cg40]|uniref:hypothetical protein n=1 Tax=Streptomyces sp. cg40 TaxID=3419764 RepID=UPI003CFBDD7F
MGLRSLGTPGASHSGTSYAICVPLLSDGAGHANAGAADWHVRLTADGRTLSDRRMDPCDLGVQDGLPTKKAAYRLSIDATRPGKDFSVGTRASAVWTFTADHVPGTQLAHFPLSVVRFTPKLSLTSTAKAGARLTVPVGIQGPTAAAPGSASP